MNIFIVTDGTALPLDRQQLVCRIRNAVAGADSVSANIAHHHVNGRGVRHIRHVGSEHREFCGKGKPRITSLTAGRRHIADRLYGASMYPEMWSEETNDEDMNHARDIGMNAVRIGEFFWSRLEPEEGHYDMAYLEGLLDRYRARGLKVAGTPGRVERFDVAVLRLQPLGPQPAAGFTETHVHMAFELVVELDCHNVRITTWPTSKVCLTGTARVD